MNYRILFFAITCGKILILTYFSLFPTIFFAGGNDSEYYDAYAQGEDSEIPNIWPVLLRALSDVGMYSREGVSYFLAFLGILVVPLLAGRLVVVSGAAFRERTFWLAALVVATYPTLFFYTFDIYRDVFMVFIFLLSLLAVKEFIYQVSLSNKIVPLFLVFGFGYFLYLLRPYLGVGFFVAFLGFNVFKFKNVSLSLCLVFFLVLLNLFFALGFLDQVLTYRETFDDMAGGSNIGIRFGPPEMFVLDFAKSFFYQIFGLYFLNGFAVTVFFIESFPFIIMLIYLIKNRRYSDSFVNYLVIFFWVYSAVWVLGNDNLGTAVRLRIYSYIAIFVAAMIVFQRKSSGCSSTAEPDIPLH